MTPEKQEIKGCYLVIDLVICSNTTNLLFAAIAAQAARHQQKPTGGDCAGDECTEFCNVFCSKKAPTPISFKFNINGVKNYKLMT